MTRLRTIVLVFVILAAFGRPAAASALTPASPNGNVSTLEYVPTAFIEAEARIGFESQQGCVPTYDDLASDSVLAARGGARATRNVHGGIANADEALRGAEEWLGEGYKEIAPGVFRSADGTRQFRMTTSDLTDPKLGPHVHFESIGPDGRTIIENSHVLVGSE